MAADKQNEDPQNPQEIMKAILQPITDAIDQLARGQTANQKAIKTLANRKQEPLLPKEVTKLLPDLINGVIKIFTTPDVAPAAASKGIFNEQMMEAFQKATIKNWDLGTLTLQEQLKSLQLENKLRDKRLKDMW